jgi:transcriptional regulator with XRE-family HTH domain
MVPNDVDPTWPLRFDWVQAGPEARDPAGLSVALSAFLQRRTSIRTQTEATTRFGRYVRALREARQWSRPQLAERANLHPLAVALLESAALTEAELSAALVSRIAMAFGTSVRDLDLNPLAIVPPWGMQPFGPSLARHLERLADYEPDRAPTRSRTVAEEPVTYQVRTDTEAAHVQLPHTLQLPSQRLALPHGGAATASLVLEPARSNDGDLLLRIWVQDEQDTPLPGILLAVDLDDRRYHLHQATDDQGGATLSLVPASLLTAHTLQLVALDA